MDRQYAVMSYTVTDGNIKETHRLLVPLDVALGELVEYIENHTYVLDNQFTVQSAGVWEDGEK